MLRVTERVPALCNGSMTEHESGQRKRGKMNLSMINFMLMNRVLYRGNQDAGVTKLHYFVDTEIMQKS